MARRCLHLAAPLLAAAACWRSPPGPPPLRGEAEADADAPGAALRERRVLRGTCTGSRRSGWDTKIRVSLALEAQGDRVVATGTIAFADRRARARLRGPRGGGPPYKLLGEMVEIRGRRTRWGLILDVDPGELASFGRLVEVLDDGGTDEMCRFVWPR